MKMDLSDIKKKYPKGTVVIMDADMNWDGDDAPKMGCKGVVREVNDAGTIFVDWGNGSNLGLIIDEDEFHIAEC